MISSVHFDFIDLRLFVHIAEENSLTRAAQRMPMSLPAASMRIKKLEESIGVPLFERTATGISLLPAGEAFLQHAQQVLSQIELLRSDLQEYARGIIGQVRILDRKSTRLNSSHVAISYAVFCLKKKIKE